MRDPLFWVPIKYKLPLTFASLCLFALGLGGYVVATSAGRALEDQIFLRLDELSAVAAIVVDRQLELLGRRVEDFASDGFIRTELEELLASRAAGKHDAASSTWTRLQGHLVQNKLPLVDAFVGALLLDRQGVPVLRVYAQTPPPPQSYETAALWFGPLVASTKDHAYPSFFLSTPVTSLEADSQIGFLQILVRADTFASHLQEGIDLPSLSSFRIWLEDTSGNTLVLFSDSPGPAQIRRGVSRTTDGSPVIEYETTIVRNGWRLQLEADRELVMAPIKGMLRRFLLVGGVLLLLVMVVWFFPARFLLKPLATLQDASRRIAEGNFSTRVSIDSRDEVGDLSRSFNTMAAAVEERTRKLEEAATILQRRETDIRFERDRLDAVIGSMYDGLFILDPEGRITLANSAAQPLVEALTQGDGRPRRVHCEHENEAEATCLRCLADFDRPLQSCVVNVDRRTYEIHATVVSVQEMAGRVFVARDITERIAQSERQAHQERMSVLGEVAAVMAHELNNPLAAVAMFSQMLEGGLEPGSSLREHAEVIRRNTESCRKTIRGLLDMATAGGTEDSPFDVHDLLRDVRRFLRPLYERAKTELTIDAVATESEVVGDELQLRQVIINLVMNALQAADGQAMIVTVTTQNCDDSLAILVSDNGPGIPPEVRNRIFEPFFTTKPPGVGTGLGLPTSKRIVEAHGGTLGLLASEPGHTVFRLVLPRGGRAGKGVGSHLPDRPAAYFTPETPDQFFQSDGAETHESP